MVSNHRSWYDLRIITVIPLKMNARLYSPKVPTGHFIMKNLILPLVASTGVFAAVTAAFAAPPSWESHRLSSEFYAEGADSGDINGDGKTDLVYGPFWFEGPDFKTSHRFTPGDSFVAEKGYSDNFFCYVVDANKDGKEDVLVYGFPGKEARLYVNPGTDSEAKENWPMHVIAPEISNESPAFIDIVPGGLPEILCTHKTSYGFYQAGDDATQPWEWHAISPAKEAGGRFEHGLGAGDVNNDGRLDIVQRTFWYEQPAELGGMWKKHRWTIVQIPGGAQILVDDVDGDGDSDIISSLKAHGYGLAWFEQYEPGKFQQHLILGETSQDNPYGVCFSQIHALALADMDGDGRKDFVTGKRYLAHQGKDPGGLQEPVLYWFQNTVTDDGIEFVPHLIDRDSGVGVEVKVVDLNADGKPDVISGNKKGLAIHLQKADGKVAAAERWKTPGGRPQDGYGSGLSPKEALERMKVPEGFSVDLIAAEPQITQPIAMCFDARGRIWAIEGHTYPVRAPEGKGKDRIVIFEDTTGDGAFDTRKVFAEGINLASGLEVGFGGVYVGAAPNLLFYADADGNDQADDEPEVLLDGWGYQDTHETLNAFTWGPDGWLYGCHGVFTHSVVGKPGTPEADRVKFNAGLWRFHPVTHKFEAFAQGTSNPWGTDFNEYGDWFVSACVIPHFFHLTNGGLYHRQGGQHFNQSAFDDIKTIADHAHYAGNIREHAFWGDNGKTRPSAPSDTSALGGGHAHCGLALYQANEFPAEYRGAAFFHNLHGHRIVREHLEKEGSGYVARHRPDFLFTHNHDFVGVGVMLGPDGALYFSDWVDPQTCHHRDVEIWDRANGRIFRVRYGDAKTTALDLPDRSDVELVQVLGNDNAFHARQAQRLLQERSVSGKLDTRAVATALTAFEKSNADHVPLRLRAFWTRYVCGLITPELIASALNDPSEYLRSWAVEFAEPKDDVLAVMEALAKDDSSLVVRRYLASKLQRLPLEQRWGIAENLISHGRSIHDPNIPLLCWYGIEPLIELDSARAFSMRNKTSWPQIKDFISRRGTLTPAGRDAVITSLSKAKNAAEYIARANEMLTALARQPVVGQPPSWGAAKQRGRELAANNRAVLDPLDRLGVRFGDPEFFPKWRAVARDGKRKPADRNKAVELLTIGNDPELGSIARELLDVAPMRPVLLPALRANPGIETAHAIVSRLDQFPLKQRNEAINLLASRPEMALVLLKAVDTDKLSSSLVSPVMLDQFAHFKNDEINALIDKNWVRGGGAVDLAQLGKAIEGWKKKLAPPVMAKADATRGRQTFTTTCGTCHKMFGAGVALGPDLTGSNRADLGYVLENVLAPSAVVGKDYMLNIFAMNDGSTVSGMIRKESPDFFNVSMPGGVFIDVKKSDIKTRTEMPQSLMPPGLFDALPLDQVADLVKYLASPQQVPLPGEKQGKMRATSSVAPPARGVTRIEGESLVGKFAPEKGRVVAQTMSGFGKGWSKNAHLWWTGAKPGDVFTFKLPGLKPGTKNISLFTTTAKDYATIKVSINGQLQETDLFTDDVLPGEPLYFENVNISPGEPLQVDVHITGKNAAAVPNYMVGIDRIEVSSAESK